MLKTLQKQFIRALIEDNSPTFIRNASPLSAKQRIAIYRDSYSLSLINALGDRYEVCQKLVGEDFFKAMARHYVEQTPSSSPNLNDYGSTFPAFVADFALAKSLIYLGDVAQLEWAWHSTLHGPDSTSLDIHSLSLLNEAEYPKLRFQLPTNSSLIASKYPIHRIWASNQLNYTNETEIDLFSGGVKLLVWRQNLDTRMDVLSESEWELLQALTSGCTLAEIGPGCSLLPQCCKRGWIAYYSFAP